MPKETKSLNESNSAPKFVSPFNFLANHPSKKSKIEANLKNLDLVNREEFEEIKSMIIKAREQNSILEAKIKTLEKKLKNYKKH